MTEVSKSVIVGYRERIELLEAENASLRARLEPEASRAFLDSCRVQLGLRQGPARALWALWDGRVKSVDSINDALFGDRPDPPELHVVAVYICQVRRAIRPYGAKITTFWWAGYQLPASEREKVAAVLDIGGAS